MTDKTLSAQVVTLLRRGQRRRPITVAELSDRLDVASGILATTCRRMHARGLLDRVPTPLVDGRMVYGYTLTAKGREWRP